MSIDKIEHIAREVGNADFANGLGGNCVLSGEIISMGNQIPHIAVLPFFVSGGREAQRFEAFQGLLPGLVKGRFRFPVHREFTAAKIGNEFGF